MRVSIIISSYNAAKYLQECLVSIQAQTFKDFECIVVDDGSTDNTTEIFSKISDKRFRLIRLDRNCGISIARNLAIKHANGEYIAVMDADDVAFPERLECQVRFLDAQPKVHFLGTRTVRVLESIDKVIDSPKHPLDDATIKARLILLNGSAMVDPTTMMRADFLHKNQLFYTVRKVDLDHALWITGLRYGARFACLEQPLLYKRRHDGNITLTEAGAKEVAKTPLRQMLFGAFVPELSYQQAASLAQIMQKGAFLHRSEIAQALEAANVVFQSTKSRFGEDRQYFNAIVNQYASRAGLALKQSPTLS